MTLAAGRMLTHFHILGPLGAGGMGEVYRARDTRLEREVAIKILPEELADDEERLRRFEREARTLASLNHPNIAGIHGVDQEGDVCFLALELVPGEDLAGRLTRGALPVEEAIDLSRQIAEGLEAAHEAGVVHRDLKPANVRITPEGVVKILDFGLAKPIRPTTTSEGTSSAESDSFLMTEEGLILGTPTYMSPEQARGKPVDRRTDVWAFGSVLFECLTGRRAFSGETFSDVLAAIVGSEPDLDALPRSTPRHVRELIARCLVKNPRERLRDVGEARLALGRTTAVEERAADGPATGRAGAWTGGLVVGGVIVSLAMVAFRGEPSSDSVLPRHVSVSLSPTPGLYEGVTNDTGFAISPDGQRVAFVTKEHEGAASVLAVRRLSEPSARVLPGTEGADLVFFSPDGEHLGFITNTLSSDSNLSRVSLADGLVQVLFKAGESETLFGGCWDPELGIVVALEAFHSKRFVATLRRFEPSGSHIEDLHVVESERGSGVYLFHPHVLPGGRTLIFTRAESDAGARKMTVQALTLDDGVVHTITEGGQARFSPTGHLLFVRLGGLLAAPFDVDGEQLTGEPRLVMNSATMGLSSGSSFDLSESGTLISVPDAGSVGSNLRLSWVGEEGEPSSAGLPLDSRGDPRLAPDGSKVAFELRLGESEVWVHDFQRGFPSRLTRAPGEDETPVWTPDGEWIVFSSSRNGEGRTIRRARVDGTGEEVVLWEGEEHTHVASCSTDGETLIVVAFGDAGSSAIWQLDAHEMSEPRPLLEGKYLRHARLSRDGKWLAYVAGDLSRPEVYVQPYPELDRRFQVSDAGGYEPNWSPGSDRLYYRSSNTIFAVDVTPASSQVFSKPRAWFEGPIVAGKGNHYSYDVASDGRLLVSLLDSRQLPTHLDLVEAWDKLLIERLGQ